MGALADGIKEIFATAKTTGTNVMICTNDGTPDGHITTSNLASVLGRETLQITTQNYDLNSAPYGRIGSSSGDISQTLVNAPEQGKRANFVCTTYRCDGADQYKVQEFVYTSASSNNPTKYIRKSHVTNTVVVWEQWFRVYDTSLLTNSTLLSPLASALGAVTLMNKSSTNLPTGAPANYGHYYQCKNSYYQLNVVMGMSSGNCTGIWVAGAWADVAFENLVWHKLSWT